MLQNLNKKLVVLGLLLVLTTPWGEALAQGRGTRQPVSCRVAAGRVEALAAVSAFAFAFTPFAPVAFAYGAIAVGAKLYAEFVCDN